MYDNQRHHHSASIAHGFCHPNFCWQALPKQAAWLPTGAMFAAFLLLI